MKKCSSCFTEKPISEFYNSNKNGKQSMCIPCYKAYFKAWRQARKAQPQSSFPTSKVCFKCGLDRPLSQFGKRSLALDKKNDYCKDCWKAISYAAQKKFLKKKAANGILE